MGGKGMNRFEDKERRKQRRHNHIARDLRTPKYRQRVVKDTKKDALWPIEEEYSIEDYWWDHPLDPDE